MIEIRKFKTKHQFKTNWNKFAKMEQFDYLIADCYCVYFFGILIYKKLEVPK